MIRLAAAAVLAVALQTLPAVAERLIPLDDIEFRGRTLSAVLADYEAGGYEFVYSRRVVRPWHPIDHDPPPGDARSRLEKILLDRRVQLRATDVPGRFLLLRVPWSPEPQPTVVTEAQEPAPRLEEVLVTSSRYALKRSIENTTTTQQLRDDELAARPEVGDDALRAALHLPGMATVGLSAQPHVRGGLRDETLILFDGVELLEPFHLKDFQSLFSGLNPSLIKSIDVYTGGFPARYGNRMSGVMDIQPATDFLAPGGELTLSLLTTGATLYGPLANGRGDWVMSARRGNLDLVTEWINPSVGDPEYGDFFTQLNFALNARHELSSTVIYFDDDILLTDGEPDDGETAISRYENLYGWLKWGSRWHDRVDSTTVLSYGSIRHNRSGVVNDEDADDSQAFAEDRRRFELWSLRHRTIIDRRQRLELGGRVTFADGRYRYNAAIRRGELAELLGIPSELDLNLDVPVNGAYGGLYASAQADLTRRLQIETGLRWDFSDYAEQTESYWSPRLSARVKLTPQTDLRLSLGRFWQPEAPHELQIVDGFTAFQRPQRATQYIVALDHRFGDSPWRARLELFAKTIHHPKQRYENLFSSLTLLPELATDRILIAADKSRVRGTEFTLGFSKRELTAALSYSYSHAEDRLQDRWRRRSWDQRHTISASAFWQSKRWTLAASALWHSGWPTTTLPTTALLDERLALDFNAATLRDYLSIDLRVSRRWQRGRHEIEAFVEVTNLLNRRNNGALEVDAEEADDEMRYELTGEPVEVLPWIPSIGLQWRF